MCEHKIEDDTFILYNVMFYDESITENDKCDSLKCEEGKCICLDCEQNGLLRKVLSEEDQIAMNFSGERIFFQNLQNRSYKDSVCKQVTPDNEIYYNGLFRNRFFPEYTNTIEQMLKTYDISNLRLLEVIKSIPILFTTNSLHKFEERDSLIYLCRFSSYAERYISILLRAVICKTLGFFQQENNQSAREAYVNRIGQFLTRLETVYSLDDNLTLNQCIDCVEKYRDIWDKMKGTRRASIVDALDEYGKQLEDRVSNCDEPRHHKLYSLLKKIFVTADLSITALPELPFTDYEDAQDIITDYDCVMDILEQVKQEEDKLKEIWEILSRIFWGGEDIPTDDMERMRSIAATCS